MHALPGVRSLSILANNPVVVSWSLILHTGSIATIWPMFGIANQLLAVIAPCVGSTVRINEGKARYAAVTLVPMAILATTTFSAGWCAVTDLFLPMTRLPTTQIRRRIGLPAFLQPDA